MISNLNLGRNEAMRSSGVIFAAHSLWLLPWTRAAIKAGHPRKLEHQTYAHNFSYPQTPPHHLSACFQHDETSTVVPFLFHIRPKLIEEPRITNTRFASPWPHSWYHPTYPAIAFLPLYLLSWYWPTRSFWYCYCTPSTFHSSWNQTIPVHYHRLLHRGSSRTPQASRLHLWCLWAWISGLDM